LLRANVYAGLKEANFTGFSNNTKFTTRATQTSRECVSTAKKSEPNASKSGGQAVRQEKGGGALNHGPLPQT
jgi:hypothetical protein